MTELVKLSPESRKARTKHEMTIRKGMKSFVDVGNALYAIREEELYVETHTSFEAYCKETWDLSRPYAYQLIDAAGVVEAVSAIAGAAPTNEAQARPLATLETEEEQAEAWERATEMAEEQGKPVNAAIVKEAVKEVADAPTPDDYDVVDEKSKSAKGQVDDRQKQLGEAWKQGLNLFSQLVKLVDRIADIKGGEGACHKLVMDDLDRGIGNFKDWSRRNGGVK